jgi:hypothetical protein
LPFTVEQDETRWLIRLEGDVNVTSATEFKGLLLEGLASAKELELDLERSGEIDLTVLQLLCAAEREAARVGSGFLSRASEAVSSTARGAGFDRLPGEAGEPKG